jgi:hypothetical protein
LISDFSLISDFCFDDETARVLESFVVEVRKETIPRSCHHSLARGDPAPSHCLLDIGTYIGVIPSKS